jgi:myo-inositol 2-dehydrogenase/D-chiro-inositol 1-dehydrogenase
VTLGIGLVGYGAWGRMHAAAIARLPGLRLAAILAHGDAGAAAAATDHPGVPVVRALDALLARDDVALVDVVAPNFLHAEIALAALASGRHVLLEKPLATDLADGERIADAVARSGLFLAVGFELRVSRQWARVKALIDDGTLGRPRFANLALFRRPFRPGAGGWRRDRARVGSWILEEPVHYLDLLCWYFGGAPVAIDAAGVPSALDPALAECFTARLDFGAGRHAVFTQMLAGFEHSLTLDLAGERGSARGWWQAAMDRSTTPAFGLKVARAGEDAGVDVPVESSGEVFELEEQLRELPARVAARSPRVSAADALLSLRLCLAAEESMRGGRPVRPA